MLRGEWFWLANEKQSNHSEEKFIYSVHKFAGIVRAEGESWEEEESNIHTIHVPVTTQTRKRVQTIGEYRTNRTGKCVILPAQCQCECVCFICSAIQDQGHNFFVWSPTSTRKVYPDRLGTLCLTKICMAEAKIRDVNINYVNEWVNAVAWSWLFSPHISLLAYTQQQSWSWGTTEFPHYIYVFSIRQTQSHIYSFHLL